MSLAEACDLSEGEEIVLDDGNIGRNETLVLTDMRLIFLKSKGRLNRTYEKDDEIPLEDVESARYDRELNAVVIQLKNDQKELITFGEDVLESFLEGSATSEVRLQATIDRWINAINDRAKRGPKRIRCSYCKQAYDETLLNCPRCGASR